MKAFLLSAIMFITATGSICAQEEADYKWEIGLNGGASSSTIPRGGSTLYEGVKSSWNPAGSLKVDYNINANWQIGGEISATKWVTTGSWLETDAFGQALQPQKVTFVVANPAISACVHVNRMIPFYSSNTHYNKSNIYYGASLGLLPTVNDGGIIYSKYNQSPDPKFTYASHYNYGFGLGYTAGVQVGYSYYIVPRFGFNIEAAGRYAYVSTNDTRYAKENDHFHVFYFPVTVGLRYRFD